MASERQDKADIGVLRGLRMLCVSEAGWRDTETLLGDIKAAGGMQADQYLIPWLPLGDLHPDNAVGSSALVAGQAEDGRKRRVLFDTGWNTQWMDKRFAEEGIDRMLAGREIEALVGSHEHSGYFWGIGSMLPTFR